MAPLLRLSATTVPRAVAPPSPLGPAVPIKIVPSQKVGLPYTDEEAWRVSTVLHLTRPFRSDRVTNRGAPTFATGTYTAPPRRAARSIAALPSIGPPSFLVQRTLPVTALSAYTVPL